MKKYNVGILFSIIGLVGMAFFSCKKFIDVPIPNNALNGPIVFSSNATASAAINGVYIRMMDEDYIQGNRGISMLAGLSSDEFSLYSGYSSEDPPLTAYYRNELTSQVSAGTWKAFYNYLNTVNSILEGLSKSTTITPDVQKQLHGEAKFLRAFFYFYLVNLYGDVPIVLTSDWRINSTISRAPKDQVWQQIIQDLKDAQIGLSDKYLKGDAKTSYAVGGEERVRPTKWAATAMLARAYLYTGDWINAEIQSSTLINNTTSYQLLPDLNKVFLKNSKEAIWQLMPVNPFFSTLDAASFIVTDWGLDDYSPVALSPYLLNAFESNDKRRTTGNWVDSVRDFSGIDYHYPSKYKVRNLFGVPGPTEYFTLLRLGEQYLIRAEARTRQDKITEAQADLNLIRNRAGLPNTNASTQSSLLAAILHERQVELFTELGHRWLDLKRTENVNSVMNGVTPVKAPGTQWQSYKQYWPIFFNDISLNPNLTQTTGY